MTVTFEQLKEGVEMDKRTHLPIKVHDDCPQCGQKNTIDLTDQYLSYPIPGKPYDLGFYCDNCEHEWQIKVRLKVALELVEE